MTKTMIIIIIFGLLLMSAIKNSFEETNKQFEQKWKESEKTSYRLNAIIDGHIIP